MPRRAHTHTLYLVRHAAAEPRGAGWPDDTRRPLSKEGRARFQRAAGALPRLNVQIDLILSSPLVRTSQTAELLAAAWPTPPRIVLSDALVPGSSADESLGEVRRHGRVASVAIVGHEPDLGRLAAHLLGSERPLPFKKGAIARIDLEGTGSRLRGTLRWFMAPRALRLIGPH